MTTHTDQIAEIKKAEEKALDSINKTAAMLEDQKRELNLQFQKLTEEKKQSLSQKAGQKMELARQEAEQIKQNRYKEAESFKNKLISDAQVKQSEAKKFIVTAFMEHIKV